MVVMVAMLAMSIDVGYMYTMQAQLQRSVDAAALAGASDLVNGTNYAQATATEYLVRNPVGSSMQVFNEDNMQAAKAQFLSDHGSGLELKLGEWNSTTRQFTESAQTPSSISVLMQYQSMPLFFGRILGQDSFSIKAQSIAMYQPRDIVVVLDFSASMNDDSEFGKIGTLGQPAIEANLLQMYGELGSPTYGNLQFAPQWAVAHGVPLDAGNGIPHVSVEYRYSSAYVTSTSNLTTVKLEFSNGNTQSFSPSSTTTGTFQGSGSNAGKQITKVWVKSWNNANQFGANGEYFSFTSSTINNTLKAALGLNSVAYPYPNGGSWDGYINYVKSSNETNDDAGYRYKFGYMNLINYWLEKYPSHAEVPDLWKASAQPVTVLKDAVDVFTDFMKEVDSNDRVALAIYDATNGNAILEKPLTTDYDSIAAIVKQRQAGHYHDYTNIGAGMQTAREELDANARPNAFKMVVLMTDGVANWRNGQYSISNGTAYVYEEAALYAAEGRKYPIMAICLGAGADTSIMQDVSEITEGRYFNVPGGGTISSYAQPLEDAFREISNHRPLVLVK